MKVRARRTSRQPDRDGRSRRGRLLHNSRWWYPACGRHVSDARQRHVAPLTVSFNSAGSNDPDGSITSYAWDFGDGDQRRLAATATHNYGAPGVYTAKLTVTDNSGSDRL
jgi:hypothetical protein